MKFRFFLKTLLLATVLLNASCNQPSENKQPAATSSQAPTTMNDCDNCATAQIILFVETTSGTPLAYNTLKINVVKNEKGRYKAQKPVAMDSENGPLSNFSIVSPSAFTRENEIRVEVDYQLQAKRIVWEAKQNALTGKYGETPFTESLKSEGGATSASGTVVFDAKTMKLLTQKSAFNEVPNQTANSAEFENFYHFSRKNLKLRLGTTINWINAECQNKDCSTELVKEQK